MWDSNTCTTQSESKLFKSRLADDCEHNEQRATLFLKPCKPNSGDFEYLVCLDGIIISSSIYCYYIHGSRIYKTLEEHRVKL